MKNKKRFISLFLIAATLAALLSSCVGIGDNRGRGNVFDIHSHVWGTWSSVKDSTCDTGGVLERKCSGCKEVQTQTIAPIGHTFGDWAEDDNGEESKTCTLCGETVTMQTEFTEFSEGLWLGLNQNLGGYLVMGPGTCTDSVIVPPLELNGFPIIGVGDGAFEDSKIINSIILPDTATYIGSKAFYRSSIKNLYLPDSVNTIGEYAFSECPNLTSIILPNSLTEISPHLFSESENLAEICLSPAITVISDYAFSQTAIKSLTLPQTLTKIGSHAFWVCSSLESITLPEGLTEIGSSAFSKCNALEEVIIPETVTILGEWLFAWSTSLKKLSLPSTLTSIPNCLCFGCTSFGEVNIPEGVTSLGKSCFAGCREMTEINLPEGITKIELGAFEGCTSLISVKLPPELRSIDTMTFSYCTSLTNLYIPENVSSISRTAFVDTGDSLTNVVIHPDNTYYYTDGSGIYSYSDKAVVQGSADGSIPKDGSITMIGTCAFEGRQNLTEIFIPKSVSAISGSAFNMCPNVTSITYEGTVEEWKKVKRGTDWFSGADIKVVHCSDGDTELIVEKSGAMFD